MQIKSPSEKPSSLIVSLIKILNAARRGGATESDLTNISAIALPAVIGDDFSLPNGSFKLLQDALTANEIAQAEHVWLEISNIGFVKARLMEIRMLLFEVKCTLTNDSDIVEDVLHRRNFCEKLKQVNAYLYLGKCEEITHQDLLLLAFSEAPKDLFRTGINIFDQLNLNYGVNHDELIDSIVRYHVSDYVAKHQGDLEKTNQFISGFKNLIGKAFKTNV